MNWENEMQQEIEKVQNSKKVYEGLQAPPELAGRVEQAVKGKPVIVDKTSRKPHRAGRWVAVAAALALCLTTGLNTSQAFAENAAKIPVLGSICQVLTFRDYEKVTADETITVKQPQIQGGQQEFTAAVNAEIDKLVAGYESQARQDIADYKEAFLATGGTEAEFAEKNIKIDVNYSVKYQQGNVLSLVLTANENWCNAYNVEYYYNLDLKNSGKLTLMDVLGPDYVEVANQSIQAQMQQRLAADPNLVYFDGSDGMAGFTTVTEDTNFYLNAQGNPVVVFAKYEIAPGAFGQQAFEIAIPAKK